MNGQTFCLYYYILQKKHTYVMLHSGQKMEKECSKQSNVKLLDENLKEKSDKLSSTWLNSAQLGSTWLNLAQLSSTRLNSAQLGSTWLNSAQLGSTRLSSAQLGST